MQAIVVVDRAAGIGGLELTEMPCPRAAENDVIVEAMPPASLRRARLAGDLDRPRRPRSDAQHSRSRGFRSRRRTGLWDHWAERGTAGLRDYRLGPQRRSRNTSLWRLAIWPRCRRT